MDLDAPSAGQSGDSDGRGRCAEPGGLAAGGPDAALALTRKLRSGGVLLEWVLLE